MTELEHAGETRWLRRVLATLETFRPGAMAIDRIDALRDAIVRLTADDDCPIATTFAPDANREPFRRHPVASVEALGCSALLMVWPAGHATTPHDHGGLWGIEVVLDGRLDVDEYVRGGTEAEPTLEFRRSLRLDAGDAATFASPAYVHRCRNRSNVAAALTLHVYGGALDAFRKFERDADGRMLEVVCRPAVDRALS
jgi:predicted metal-dependent enzyme (double-stranded beta helix superfamily)